MFFGGSTAARRARRPGADSGPGAGRTIVLAGAAVGGTGLLALSAVAWTSPETVATTRPVQVHQQVALTYSAQAPRGAAYPTGRVRTGDPVFLRLVPRMNVAIAYRARAGGAQWDGVGPAGTRRVTAELRSANGWHRGFELLPREPFTGAGFDADTVLDLRHVQALVTGVQKATGVQGRYTLSVRSEIALTGSILGAAGSTAVRDSFFPELTFDYDGQQLQPADRASTTEVLRGRSSTVPVPARRAARLDVAGLDLPVGPARKGGLIGGAGLLLLAAVTERGRRIARRTPPERVVRRIVLDDPAATAPNPSRSRVSEPRGPRTATLAGRGWTRAHSGAHDRDRA